MQHNVKLSIQVLAIAVVSLFFSTTQAEQWLGDKVFLQEVAVLSIVSVSPDGRSGVVQAQYAGGDCGRCPTQLTYDQETEFYTSGSNVRASNTQISNLRFANGSIIADSTGRLIELRLF